MRRVKQVSVGLRRDGNAIYVFDRANKMAIEMEIFEFRRLQLGCNYLQINVINEMVQVGLVRYLVPEYQNCGRADNGNRKE